MKKPLQPIAVIGIAVLIMAGVSLYMRRGNDIIPWRTDYAAGRAEAAQTSKPVLLYFTADYCLPCQEMKHTTWASEEVKQALDGYVPVKLDITRKENVDLAIAYGIRESGIPQIYIIDDGGRVTRTLDDGSTPERFIRWIKGK